MSGQLTKLWIIIMLAAANNWNILIDCQWGGKNINIVTPVLWKKEAHISKAVFFTLGEKETQQLLTTQTSCYLFTQPKWDIGIGPSAAKFQTRECKVKSRKHSSFLSTFTLTISFIHVFGFDLSADWFFFSLEWVSMLQCLPLHPWEGIWPKIKRFFCW